MPRQSEIDRMIVMIYRSSNAHDFTNFVRPAGWLDKLPMKGLEELCQIFEVMRGDVDREIDARKSEGIESFEEAFLANIVMPDGRTVSETTIPAIENHYQGRTDVPLLPHH